MNTSLQTLYVSQMGTAPFPNADDKMDMTELVQTFSTYDLVSPSSALKMSRLARRIYPTCDSVLISKQNVVPELCINPIAAKQIRILDIDDFLRLGGKSQNWVKFLYRDLNVVIRLVNIGNSDL